MKFVRQPALSLVVFVSIEQGREVLPNQCKTWMIFRGKEVGSRYADVMMTVSGWVHLKCYCISIMTSIERAVLVAW